MPTDEFKNATEAVKRAKRTLVVAPENPSHDAVCSAAALLSYLNSHGNNSDAYVPKINHEKIPDFVNHKNKILHELAGTRDFRIAIDVNQAPIHEFAYDVKDGKLEIVLTPKSGEWTQNDVSLHPGEDRYDLVIAIDFADRQLLGKAFHNHADFIYRVPVINIDHKAKNEHWAPINLVDLTAGSVAEVVHGWMDHWNEQKIDKGIATSLLAGMIYNTQSFKAPTVTPKTLERAAKLISLGADRGAVVQQLWRTRNVNTLKLWGRALTRLEQDADLEMVWTTLTRQDILETGTTEAKLDELVSELIAYAPNAKLIAIFVEHDENTTRTALFAEAPHDARTLGRPLGLDGTREKVSGAIAKPVLEAKDHAVQTLRVQLKN
ncbi:MAG: DHH family phosphoesterase [Patescibacteria group bacterium]